MPEQTHRHAAIMFTDIVGYTALMGADEDKAFEILEKNTEIHNKLIAQHNGALIKAMGDGMLVSFNLASDAVRSAIEIQKECKAQNIPLKIGIHEGEMVFADADVLGDAVNIASRLQDDAEVGSISISSSVYKNVRNKAGINTSFVEERTFKNVEEPVKVYQVLNEGEKAHTVQNRQKKASKKYVYYLFGVVIIVLAILLLRNYFPTSAPGAIDKERSIAVLPFDDLSPNQDQEHFSIGMMEEIINHLYKIEGLRVTSRTTSMKYRGAKLSAKEIAEEIGVTNILEGSVRKDGNRLRITVQFIDAINDKQLSSEIYDRNLTDVFAIQSEVAQNVASILQIQVQPEVRLSIESQPTSSVEAYELFLQAWAQWYSFTLQGRYEAQDLLEQAIQIDPEFANAYAVLGMLKSTFAWGGNTAVSSSEEAYETAVPYLERALELDPDNSLAHLYSAWTHLWYKWDFKTVEKEYQFLVNQNRNYTNTDFLLASGRYSEAVERAETAVEIDPLSSGSWQGKILSYYFNGQHDESLSSIQTSLNANFQNPVMLVNIFRIYLYLNMYEEIIQMTEQFFVDWPDYKEAPRPLGILAIAYYQVRDLEKANEILQRLQERSEQTSVGSPSFYIAMIYAQMGEIDTAFEWLDKAYEDHEVEMYWLKVEPPFDPLHDDPRWQEMLDKVGFPE